MYLAFTISNLKSIEKITLENVKVFPAILFIMVILGTLINKKISKNKRILPQGRVLFEML